MGIMKGKKGTDGAPPKITYELINKIAAALQRGSYVETAAAYCGIHKSALYKWLKKGNEKPRSIHGALVDAVSKAMAQAELSDLDKIQKAADNGEWKAAAWRLERRHPKKWGHRAAVEHSGSIAQGISSDNLKDIFSDPDDLKMARALAEKLSIEKRSEPEPESEE